MNDAIIGFDQPEEDVLSYEISDEELEIAGNAAKENTRVTVVMCTGQIECPF